MRTSAAAASHALALVAVAVFANASGARADQPATEARHSSLSWVRTAGAESCLASAPLARAVEERLGRSVFVSASAGEIAVEGRAERTSDGFRAVILVTDAAGATLGERTLESTSVACDELGEMVTLTIALMIDPLTAPDPSPPPEPVVVERVERVEVPLPRAATHRIEVDATLVGAIGTLPSASVGGQISLVARPPNFVPLVLEGGFFPFGTAANGTGDARFLELYAGLAICPAYHRFTTVELHACVGADAGAMLVRGHASGVDDTERILGRARASLRVHWDVYGRLTLRAGVHFVVPFRHEPYTSGGGASTLYTPSPVAGMLDLGLGVHFP